LKDRRTIGFLGTTRAFHQRNATNPRDHIYGLLGLADPAWFADYTPDYNADVTHVYTQAFRRILAEYEGDLKPLTRHHFNTSKMGLPSWVPDFSASVEYKVSANEWQRHRQYSLYSASKGKDAIIAYPNAIELQLRGFLVDKVKRTGPQGTSKPHKDFPIWWDIAKTTTPSYTSETELLDHFWRTVRGDVEIAFSHQPGEQKRNTTAYSEAVSVWARCSPAPSDALEHVQHLLQGSVRTEAALSNKLLAAIDVQTYNRVFFISVRGHIGFGDGDVQADDEVWVLLGSNIPFCLRPHRGDNSADGNIKYTFLGACYLDGFMDGQALDGGEEERDVVIW
jgi:hypothetical protein